MAKIYYMWNLKGTRTNSTPAPMLAQWWHSSQTHICVTRPSVNARLQAITWTNAGSPIVNYLNQWWHSSMSHTCVARPQRVNVRLQAIIPETMLALPSSITWTNDDTVHCHIHASPGPNVLMFGYKPLYLKQCWLSHRQLPEPMMTQFNVTYMRRQAPTC